MWSDRRLTKRQGRSTGKAGPKCVRDHQWARSFLKLNALYFVECDEGRAGVTLSLTQRARILTINRCTDPCSHYESRPEFLSPPAYSNKPLPWSSLLQIAAVSMLGL